MAFVQALGTQFRLENQAFYFSGANNYYFGYKSNFMVDAVLDAAQSLGLKVIRTCGFWIWVRSTVLCLRSDIL